MSIKNYRGAMFVSFDAVAVSGITVEALKCSRALKDKGYQCYLDLGYDIKIDKGNFNKPYTSEHEIYREALTLTRIDNICRLPYYTQSFIEKVHNILISESVSVSASELATVKQAVAESAFALSKSLVTLWQSLNIGLIVVENGTLPENIIYTRALYMAIENYGRENKLGCFVIWRDHDLMWNSEKNVMKYGSSPWPNAVKPITSSHISYVTLNQDLKKKLEAWCHYDVQVSVRKNTYDFHSHDNCQNIRPLLGIPEDDILIARTTRIIPQKRLDRDVHLVTRLNELFKQTGDRTRVWLVIAGDVHERKSYFEELQKLASEADVANYIVYTGALHHNFMPVKSGVMTIEDLYHSCNLVSFLTSWDYDSYGNPIGEAISSKRCYITTQYEYYHEVYGQHGFEALIMPISSECDGQPDEKFIQNLFSLLNNRQRMDYLAESNFLIGKSILANNLTDIFNSNDTGGAMRNTVFVSVVLPVFNESDRIDAVLTSLYHQKTKNELITHNTYEIIIVDNNSKDDSVLKIMAFKNNHPDMDIHIIEENIQGVSSARKRGMDYSALRSREKESRTGLQEKHYIVSADADCTVDDYWLHTLIDKMIEENGDLCTCNYYYNYENFRHRPRLFNEIQKTLRCRDFSFTLFGGFPDGKGFAVERDLYEKVGGIEIFYQIDNGKFVEHLSDDWDFGIKVIAYGGKPVYASKSSVEINSRRVDTILDEVINGIAYGCDGTIIMKDVRPDMKRQIATLSDVNEMQARQAWFYSIKDYIPKNIILPVLLNPHILLERDDVREFFSAPVAERLCQRIYAIKNEMRIIDFKPIHAYKTPAYRLYFEFREEIFAALRRSVGEDIGFPPPLPTCFDPVCAQDFERFVWYFCEDRESGEAHNYFANGGVF